MAYQVQVRGEFGGAVGGWRPGVTGTLNQTGQSDADASRAETEADAEELAALVLEAGASPDDVRVVEV